jgi:hypothetical protein
MASDIFHKQALETRHTLGPQSRYYIYNFIIY